MKVYLLVDQSSLNHLQPMSFQTGKGNAPAQKKQNPTTLMWLLL